MAPKTSNKQQNVNKPKRAKNNSLIAKPKLSKVRTIQYLRIKCPICFENINREAVSSTKCGHVFCTQCLQKALKRMSACPTCRTRIKGKGGHHPLYLDTNVCEEIELVEILDNIDTNVGQECSQGEQNTETNEASQDTETTQVNDRSRDSKWTQAQRNFSQD